MRKIKSGFTILELLVVIAIVGMLSTIIFTNLNGARAKSRDSRRVTDIKQLQSALQLYFNDNKMYPPTLDPNLLVPLYIQAVLRDPVGNTNYSYAALQVSSRCTDYHLGASLETVAAGQGLLANDFDSSSSGTLCVGSAGNFDGADIGKCNAADGGIICYDVRP